MWKKWITLLLLQCFGWLLHAQIENIYPPITIESAEISVADILAEITAQTGLNFTYNPRSIAAGQRIEFAVRQVGLEETLSKLGEQIKVDYRLIKGQIVLTPKVIREETIEESFTLSGFIEDQASGESLIGATAAVAGTARGAVTNAFGFYSLPLQRGRHALNYSYVGYGKKEVDLELLGDQRTNVTLQPAPIDLPDITVALPEIRPLDQRDPGHLKLAPADLNQMPEFGGESGLIKGLQSLPGIKMHSDGSAFFYVRGGDRDQNLIIVDDAPIYNPAHLFGFYSVIIPDFTKSIQVYKSDIPANLGDRLSSIISIRTKDGNLNKVSFNGAVSPLINHFSLEVPLIKQKGGIFAAVRRSNFEWLYQEAAPDARLGFGDFNFKVNYKPDENNRLFFTAIASGDNFTNLVEGGSNAGIRWGNLAATLRWNRILGPKLFSNTTLYTGNFAYRLFSEPNYWQSALGTLSLKSDFTHYTSPALTSKFGIEAQAYFIDPGSVAVDSTIAVLPEIKANYSRKLVAYYQGELDLGKKWQARAGFRLINWANLGPATYYDFSADYTVADTIRAGEGPYHSYTNIDPRINLRFQLDSTSRLDLSAGLYHQYLQLISNAESPFNSFEVWLPADPNIRPQASRQLSLSYLKYFKRAGLEFSAAGYYKQFEHQIDYAPHATTLLNPLIEGELRFGSMRSYGLEVSLKKDVGRLSGWMNYTYSRALRQTPDLNGGREYPAFQDRPHDFSLMLNYRLSSRWLFSAYYTAYNGLTFSSPTGFYQFNDQTVPVYAEKNNDRLPTYRRFDFAFKFLLNKDLTRRFQHSLTFSLYNALGHKNIVSVNFNKIPVEGERPVVKANLLSDVPLSPSQIDLIRFFPSLTYKFEL